MPIYEYECQKCGVFDYEQSIADRPLARCPKCRSKVTKLISASAFHLKGGGWYADGYNNKSAGASPASGASDSGASSGSTSTAATPTSTPAAKEPKKGNPRKDSGSAKSG